MIDAVRFPLAMIPVLALFSAPGMAAPIAAPVPPQAQAALMRPLTLTKLADMDFGNLAVTTAGTAVIDPVTNTMAVTGGVIRLGGIPHAARFAAAASGSPVVIIRIPNGAVTLTRSGGTQTLVVDNFRLDGQSKRTMAQSGKFEFAVGATLRPAANQAEGVYSGTFDVTIQYP